jgi:hypothetical protein
MSQNARQQLARRALTKFECKALAQVWEDDMWSLCLEEEERGTDHHRAIRNSSLAMQEPADVLDEGAESDNDSTISDSSVSSFESHFEEDRSDFEAERSDCEVQRASNALKPTAGCTDSSPHNDHTSRSREEDAEGLKGLGFEGALEDLMLQLGYFLVTEEHEDGRSSSTLLVYFSGDLRTSNDGLTFERPSNYTTKLSALIYCSRLSKLSGNNRVFLARAWYKRPLLGPKVPNFARASSSGIVVLSYREVQSRRQCWWGAHHAQVCTTRPNMLTTNVFYKRAARTSEQRTPPTLRTSLYRRIG